MNRTSSATRAAGLLPVRPDPRGDPVGQGRLDERIWLNFNAAAPEAVFRVIAGAIRVHAEINPAVQQKVSIRLERVTLKLALDAICESIGCRWTVDGPQLLVDPLPAPRPASPSARAAS